MTAKAPDGSKTRLTLTDDDILSQRSVTRRKVLGGIGLGAGVAAGVVLGSTESAHADADAKKKKKKAKPKEAADSD
jgi:hypothetical protein